MIDSVLKGTGNSRFLKSAVPAGTSWADALAMLQAGTFPIDFNGINTEGFQQVGTPLNKANLLKDATAAQIGLPPSTTPDGMFRALGNTGELHVWRKTVKDSAGYTLGSAAQLANLFGGNTGGSKFRSSLSLSVSDDGTPSLLNEDSRFLAVSWEQLVSFLNSGFKSKFIICEGYPNSIYYIPQDAEYSLTGNYLNVSKAQLVSGYPAAYTTTYPVSTNPNAYQEGDDAKAAGYTLGEVVTGKYYLGNANVGYVMSYKTATSLSVSDNGVLSMPTDATSFNVTYSKNGLTTDQIKSYFAGKFVQLVAVGSDSVFSPSSLFKTAPSEILFIPSDSVVTKDEFKNFNIDRYQPVTGYAAIPAGTTIEYLGKLGDKARVQVVSYVGTGTYGKDNPCSISVDFPMKAIVFLARVYTNESDKKISTYFVNSSYTNDVSSVLVEQVPTTYSQSLGLGNNYYSNNFGKRSKDRKSYYWYNTSNESDQGNFAGTIYYFLVIG